jgi:hypothetical protein
VARVGFEGHDPPVRRQCAGEPDRAVAAERPDLEDRPRAAQPRQQLEQPALRRGNGGRGQPSCGTRRERLVEHGLARRQMPGQVAVDRLPAGRDRRTVAARLVASLHERLAVRARTVAARLVASLH